MLEMVERFVKAVEDIAGAVRAIAEETSAEPVRTTEAPVTPREHKTVDSPQAKGPEGALVYNDMTHGDLAALCRDRGIEIPKGTKKPTLVKKLRSNDAVPQPEPAPEPDPDPFVSGSSPEMTMDIVRDKLREVQQTKGNMGVIDVLMWWGNTTRLAALAPGKYQQTYDGAVRYLAMPDEEIQKSRKEKKDR